MPRPTLRLIRATTADKDTTHLHLGEIRIATANHDTKEFALHGSAVTTSQDEFLAVLYAMLITGVQWGYLSPLAADDLHTDVIDRLGLNGYDDMPQAS